MNETTTFAIIVAAIIVVVILTLISWRFVVLIFKRLKNHNKTWDNLLAKTEGWFDGEKEKYKKRVEAVRRAMAELKEDYEKLIENNQALKIKHEMLTTKFEGITDVNPEHAYLVRQFLFLLIPPVNKQDVAEMEELMDRLHKTKGSEPEMPEKDYGLQNLLVERLRKQWQESLEWVFNFSKVDGFTHNIFRLLKENAVHLKKTGDHSITLDLTNVNVSPDEMVKIKDVVDVVSEDMRTRLVLKKLEFYVWFSKQKPNEKPTPEPTHKQKEWARFDDFVETKRDEMLALQNDPEKQVFLHSMIAEKNGKLVYPHYKKIVKGADVFKSRVKKIRKADPDYVCIKFYSHNIKRERNDGGEFFFTDPPAEQPETENKSKTDQDKEPAKEKESTKDTIVINPNFQNDFDQLLGKFKNYEAPTAHTPIKYRYHLYVMHRNTNRWSLEMMNEFGWEKLRDKVNELKGSKPLSFKVEELDLSTQRVIDTWKCRYANPEMATKKWLQAFVYNVWLKQNTESLYTIYAGILNSKLNDRRNGKNNQNLNSHDIRIGAKFIAGDFWLDELFDKKSKINKLSGSLISDFVSEPDVQREILTAIENIVVTSFEENCTGPYINKNEQHKAVKQAVKSIVLLKYLPSLAKQ